MKSKKNSLPKPSDFKIRCSQIGQIMTSNRAGTGIGETAKSYVQTWAKEKIYCRSKLFTSKYTDKGNIVEEEAIQYVCDYLGLGFLFKNEKNYSDDYMTGTPDCIGNDFGIDIKASWDCFTFPYFEEKIPNSDYMFQAQGYMNLTGVSNYFVCYVLLDTPEHIIEQDAFYFSKKNSIDFDDELINTFRKNMTFSGIPDKYRIKVFELQKDQEIIDKIIKKVEQSREYLLTILK